MQVRQLARTLLCLAGAALPAASARAYPQEAAFPLQLAQMSIEELADIKVTSVSRKAESLAAAAAAIYVITREDIRRTGVDSLPEALRLAPNLEVARINANNWIVTARGGTTSNANKMLVMIDGRVIYNPLDAGVFWEAQDTPLDAIERIAVISAPGGTLWGSNAVNGVINILTRSARVELVMELQMLPPTDRPLSEKLTALLLALAM